ncbi:MAG TPA: TIGR03364 family FAD-dependent oxidoreductase [Flavitalea sp.]|nr:TIGR03364 family FAD-dependent oxidoreductase [Flavitalea sp.]
MSNKSAIVVGAGIVGLATARALAFKGYTVSVFERSDHAVGASIRNFGLILPFAQPNGALYERAMQSRSIWKEISQAANFSHDPAGSMFVAYEAIEWQVLQEVFEIYGKSRTLRFIRPEEVLTYSPAINSKGLLGGLFSPDELIVDPREAIATIPSYLESVNQVRFYWNRAVQSVASGKIVSNGKEFEADLVFVCTGAEFESLYPELYSTLPITKCRLQMMRTAVQPGNWRIGPALCGGLSLIHYKSFSFAPSIDALKHFYEETMGSYTDRGIHVMVTQNAQGELTIGDSHQYGHTFDPFEEAETNELILKYLKGFASFRNMSIVQNWSGVYSKMTNGDTEIFQSPEPGVFILNALGGAGMTLSFGLAEEVVNSL